MDDKVMHNWAITGITKDGDIEQRCHACGVTRVVPFTEYFRKA